MFSENRHLTYELPPYHRSGVCRSNVPQPEEEEEEAVKPNVRDKIGFRDNRVSWLRFESIHFRENRESERNKERDKLKVLVFQECFGE